MGAALTTQGDEGAEFFVIVTGDASAAVDGNEVGTIGPGGFFGEMALIDGGERVATVTATSPMQLLVLDRHDFNEMLELAMPQIAPKLLAVVGARMRAIEERTGVDATLGSEARVEVRPSCPRHKSSPWPLPSPKPFTHATSRSARLRQLAARAHVSDAT